MVVRLKKFLNKILPAVFTIAGSLIISFCWNWYHYDRHNVVKISWLIFFGWLGVMVGFIFVRWLFLFFVKKFDKHYFWQQDFVKHFPSLFFCFSLLFIIFLLKSEVISLVYSFFVLLFLFWRIDRSFIMHPESISWQKVNKTLFLLFFYIFLLNAIWQFLAYKYYILNINNKYFNIVLFRTITITMVWLAGFAVATMVYLRFQMRWRFILLTGWFLLFLSSLFIWMVNLGVLYFSGLYFSPMILSYAKGGFGVLKTDVVYWLILLFFITAFSFIFIFFRTIKTNLLIPKHRWYYYYSFIVCLAIGVLLAFSSFKTTPEFLITKSFLEQYKNKDKKEFVLPDYIFEKLKKFGLNYDQSKLLVAHKESAFETKKNLLPDKFNKQNPNVIIFFLESFSARLTDVYNPQIAGVTPNLNEFANSKDTVIFKNYYNASFPTITGIMAQMCSYLPPTGHSEIDTEKRFQTHRLLCLPKILKDEGGYKSTTYLTVVDKDFSNKDMIFGRMGMNKVYGKDEMGKMIDEDPLGWGYTDHQAFPLFLPLIRKSLEEPFLMVYSSIDTHVPFTLSSDMPEYKDNSNPVLRSFHSTDDAFGKFWDEFKKSEYFENTIVITVADHPVFNSAYLPDYFPNEFGKHNEYDEQLFLMHIPNNVLPKEIDVLASSIDFAPTLLQILNINSVNSFEGHSIFDDRKNYPELLGMYERSIYINQTGVNGERKVDYGVMGDMNCKDSDYNSVTSSPLTICELNQFYMWKRQMAEEGRFWENQVK